MSGVRSFAALTLVALAFGGVAAAVLVALGGGPSSGARDGSAASVDTVVVPEDPGGTANSETAFDGIGATPTGTSARGAGLTQRIDDEDEGVRHALALELLRRGPDALAQARALRPTTSAGADLQNRLVLALDKMRLLRRANDYAKLPEHLRMRLDLDAFASVVPEELLVGERQAYWERELAAVRYRRSKGAADEAEESLALLELERARREAGRCAPAEYAARARELLPGIEAWVSAQRRERATSPAVIRDLEEQVDRLRP